MGTHYYKKGEFSLPSVTTIISDCTDKSYHLTRWSAKMACEWIRENTLTDFYGRDKEYHIVFPDDLDNAAENFKEVSQTALDIGSETHAVIEHWLKTGEEHLNPRPEVLNAFRAFKAFFTEHNMKTHKIEFSVFGDYWAGTLDWFGEFDNKLYVIDWKTSRSHYPNQHGPQIAAYRSRVNAKVEGCAVLRIDKETGLPDFKDYSKRYEKDLEHFLLMKNLFLHRHPIIAKNAGYSPPF